MTCSKVSFNSFQQAAKAAKYHRIRVNARTHPYKCPTCNKFHLTGNKS